MVQYKVRNWSEYNESLKKCSSLSLWISEDAIKNGNRQEMQALLAPLTNIPMMRFL